MLLTSRRRRPRRLEQAPEFLVLLVPGRGREQFWELASSNVPSQASKPAAPPKIAPLTVTAPATAISPRVVTASSRSTPGAREMRHPRVDSVAATAAPAAAPTRRPSCARAAKNPVAAYKARDPGARRAYANPNLRANSDPIASNARTVAHPASATRTGDIEESVRRHPSDAAFRLPGVARRLRPSFATSASGSCRAARARCVVRTGASPAGRHAYRPVPSQLARMNAERPGRTRRVRHRFACQAHSPSA